jgi:hypothetical protein
LRADAPPFADAQPRPRFAAFFEANAALGNEIVVAFRSASLFEHRRERQRAAQDLRHHQTADPVAPIEIFAESDTAAGVIKRAIANVLSALEAGRSMCRVRHGRRDEHPECHVALAEMAAIFAIR